MMDDEAEWLAKRVAVELTYDQWAQVAAALQFQAEIGVPGLSGGSSPGETAADVAKQISLLIDLESI
jgi:hypothetical protein